jgi:hypothetical protein
VVDSSPNRNEYQESSWGVMGGQGVRLTTLVPSMSQLSRRCGSLDLSHNTGLHGLLTGRALPLPFIIIIIIYSIVPSGA